MVTDYARKTAEKPSRQPALIASIILIVVAIAFPLSLFFIKLAQSHHRVKSKKPAISNSHTPKKPSAQPHQLTSAAKFDFYTLLPNMPINSTLKNQTRTPR